VTDCSHAVGKSNVGSVPNFDDLIEKTFGLLLRKKAARLKRITVTAVCAASNRDLTGSSLNCFKCF